MESAVGPQLVCNAVNFQQLLTFLDVLKSLELPRFVFSGIGAGTTHLGGCSIADYTFIDNCIPTADSTLHIQS